MLSSVWACVAAQERSSPTQPESRPFRILTGPYLQNASENAMTVMWITDRNATGAVEFGLPDSQLKTASSSHDGLIDSNERVHKVLLSGLSPGTGHRAVSRDILVFNDMHEGPAIFAEMLKVAGDVPTISRC